MPPKGTVLIVDDEPFTHDIIEGFLHREGYNLVFASNGVEALNCIETIKPDVILLDVMMSGVDGLEVCRRLKADERWQPIPIILVTALTSKEDLIAGFEAGANDFIRKPVNELELRARVRSMMRIKQQYDRLETTLSLREDLAHMIVHDIRSPLSVIAGISELLQMQNNLTPANLAHIRQIQTEVRHLDSFVNDLLMVAKMEADQPVLNRSLVDIPSLARQVEQTHQIAAQSKKIKLVFDLPTTADQVWLDVNLFQRLLDNLISNALKFSPAQSTVIVRAEYRQPSPELPEGATQLRVQV